MKPIWKSKTFWFNALALAVTAAEILPPKWAGPVAAIGNIGLRIVSGQPIRLFSEE